MSTTEILSSSAAGEPLVGPLAEESANTHLRVRLLGTGNVKRVQYRPGDTAQSIVKRLVKKFPAELNGLCVTEVSLISEGKNRRPKLIDAGTPAAELALSKGVVALVATATVLSAGRNSLVLSQSTSSKHLISPSSPGETQHEPGQKQQQWLDLPAQGASAIRRTERRIRQIDEEMRASHERSTNPQLEPERNMMAQFSRILQSGENVTPVLNALKALGKTETPALSSGKDIQQLQKSGSATLGRRGSLNYFSNKKDPSLDKTGGGDTVGRRGSLNLSSPLGSGPGGSESTLSLQLGQCSAASVDLVNNFLTLATEEPWLDIGDIIAAVDQARIVLEHARKSVPRYGGAEQQTLLTTVAQLKLLLRSTSSIVTRTRGAMASLAKLSAATSARHLLEQNCAALVSESARIWMNRRPAHTDEPYFADLMPIGRFYDDAVIKATFSLDTVPVLVACAAAGAATLTPYIWHCKDTGERWLNLFGTSTAVPWLAFTMFFDRGIEDCDTSFLRSMLDHGRTGFVFAAKFDALVRTFGGDHNAAVRNAVLTAKHSWFYGYMRSSDSQTFLEWERLNCFLVRFGGSHPDALVLSFKFEGAIIHSNILRVPQGYYVVYQHDGTFHASIDRAVLHIALKMSLEPWVSTIPHCEGFRGHATSRTVEESLREQPTGTFLIRFASKARYLSVARVASDGTLIKTLVKVEEDGCFYTEGESGSSQFSSLDLFLRSLPELTASVVDIVNGHLSASRGRIGEKFRKSEEEFVSVLQHSVDVRQRAMVDGIISADTAWQAFALLDEITEMHSWLHQSCMKLGSWDRLSINLIATLFCQFAESCQYFRRFLETITDGLKAFEQEIRRYSGEQVDDVRSAVRKFVTLVISRIPSYISMLTEMRGTSFGTADALLLDACTKLWSIVRFIPREKLLVQNSEVALGVETGLGKLDSGESYAVPADGFSADSRLNDHSDANCHTIQRARSHDSEYGSIIFDTAQADRCLVECTTDCPPSPRVPTPLKYGTVGSVSSNASCDTGVILTSSVTSAQQARTEAGGEYGSVSAVMRLQKELQIDTTQADRCLVECTTGCPPSPRVPTPAEHGTVGSVSSDASCDIGVIVTPSVTSAEQARTEAGGEYGSVGPAMRFQKELHMSAVAVSSSVDDDGSISSIDEDLKTAGVNSQEAVETSSTYREETRQQLLQRVAELSLVNANLSERNKTQAAIISELKLQLIQQRIDASRSSENTGPA